MIEGIKGPGISGTDTELQLPDCVKPVTPKDENDVVQFVAQVIHAANVNAVALLAELLGDQAPDLLEHFRAKLNA